MVTTMHSIESEPTPSEGLRLERLQQLYYAGAWSEAERLCEEIVTASPRDVRVLILRGEIALIRGDRVEACKRLRRAWQTAFPDLEALLRLIRLTAQVGDWAPLERVREILAEQSAREAHDFGPALALAIANEMLGRIDEALSVYGRVIAIKAANASAHTNRALLLLRRAWINPLPAPEEKRQPTRSRGRLGITVLGKMGRFGNQLFQYAYARIYGQVHGLSVEVPDWIGRWVFDLDDPKPDPRAPLAPLRENPAVMGDLLAAGAQPLLANRDLWGYCQCHTSHLRPHRTLVRALFRPGARLRPSIEAALARVRQHGRTLVAVHLRRGDYTGGERFWPAPASWYVDWLSRLWAGLDAPVLYVASDDPGIVRDFAAFSPVASAGLEPPIPGAEMYPDFHILSEADILAISNSSFSVTAAMLNSRARLFVRPDPSLSRLVPFDPWNTEVLWSAPGSPQPSG